MTFICDGVPTKNDGSGHSKERSNPAEESISWEVCLSVCTIRWIVNYVEWSLWVEDLISKTAKLNNVFFLIFFLLFPNRVISVKIIALFQLLVLVL